MAISNIRAGTQEAALEYQARKDNIRKELQNQYDNLVAYDKKLAYRGRKSDLNKIFNQQANQLAKAGIASIGDLRVQDKKLVNSVTGDVIKTSNLKGAVYRDRDTGAMKWGDIFSGVEGGANYGISTTEDGSVILYPVYEKSKSPLSQIGLGKLEGVITPLLTIGGALVGVPGLGAVGGAAAGAGIGNTTGQLLASGKVDWEKVFASAAVAGAGAGIKEALSGAEAVSTGALPDASSVVVPDSLAAPFFPGDPSAITSSSLLGADASFIAADATQLAGQGLSEAAIAQNLAAAGVDTANANLAANLAVSGSSAETIANTLSSFAPEGTSSLFTGTEADLAAAGITTGGVGAAMSAADIAAGSTAAGAGASMLGEGAGAIVDAVTGTDIVDEVLGILSSGAGTAIDFEALRKVRDRALKLGKETEATSIAAGEAANVPFTPYTVRTGAGTTEFGTDATGRPTATVTASPEYEALRGQALDLAGTTLGTIDPANAARSLFERSEALAGPARERETTALLSSLGAKGLLGFGQNLPTVGGTIAGVNPFVESLLSAQRTAQATAALEAEKFGTTEAQRQAELANALIGTGRGIDTEAARTLGFGKALGETALGAEQTSARNLLEATLKGQALRLPYDQQALLAEIDAILGVRDFAKSGASRAIESDAVRGIIKEIFGT